MKILDSGHTISFTTDEDVGAIHRNLICECGHTLTMHASNMHGIPGTPRVELWTSQCCTLNCKCKQFKVKND